VLRAERGLTLREAASKTGVRPGTLSELERGLRHPHDITLSRIARGYNVSIEDLFDLEEEPREEPAELPKSPAPVSQGSALESGGVGEVHLHVSDLKTALERGSTSFSEVAEFVEHYCQEWEESFAEEPTPKMRERGTTFAAGAHTTAGRDAFISASAVILPALMIARNAEILVLEHELGLSWDDPQDFIDCLGKSEVFAASRRYTRLLEAIMDAEIKAEEDHEAEREAIRRRQEIREWSRRLGVA